MTPFWTVVIPSYNRAAQLPEAVEAVLGQTDPELELIIVDDGSTDETAAYLAGLGDPRVKTLQQDRAGACRARNLGAEQGRAPYLTFLDSDDTVERDWLESMRGALQDGPTLVVCGFRVVDSGRIVTESLPRPTRPSLSPLPGPITQAGSYALPRDVFLEVGGFFEDMPAAQHTELAFRLADVAEAGRLAWASVHRVLLEYRRHGGATIRSNDLAVARASDLLVTRHLERLRREPRRLANSYSTGGVRWARAGDLGAARARFWKAATTFPRDYRHWLRWLLACLPPLGRIYWKRG